MSILQPRKDRFFDLFEDAAANASKSAELLLALLNDYSDVATKAATIKEVEHHGDAIQREIFEQLEHVFIAPLHREDIRALASVLDDLVDLIEASADDFVLYDVDKPTGHAVELAEIIVRSAAQVRESFRLLSSRRTRQDMRAHLIEINRLENAGDTVYRDAVQTLFRQPDPVLIIKWMQIYQHLEHAIDSCEHIADVLHDILLKYG